MAPSDLTWRIASLTFAAETTRSDRKLILKRGLVMVVPAAILVIVLRADIGVAMLVPAVILVARVILLRELARAALGRRRLVVEEVRGIDARAV